MRVFNVVGLGAFATMGLLGCAADQVAAPEARGLKVAVAPLNLPGIGFACYDLLVENGAGQTVWSQGEVGVSRHEGDDTTICSDDYGNGVGGDITYIGPCDATSDTVPGDTVQNSVTIWVDGLYTASGSPLEGVGDGATGQNWQNPCNRTGADEGCTLNFDCIENVDTLVEFNFTIMREANQGFFDIAVNFEDVFCSAKVDCRYANNSLIRLVHDLDGDRRPTAVFGFACTDGDAGNDTRLYVSNVEISCSGDESSVEIDVSEPGNVYSATNLPPEPWLAQAMVFQGKERLLNGLSNADKLYWNVGVAFAETALSVPETPTLVGQGCTLRVYGTASKGDLQTSLGKDNVTYPYLMAQVEITDDAGLLVCQRYPVNSWDDETENGLGTFYTPLGVGLPVGGGGPQWWEMKQVEGDIDVNAYPDVP